MCHRSYLNTFEITPRYQKYCTLVYFEGMWKNIRKFVKHYYLFAVAITGAAGALALDLQGLDTYAHWLLIAVAAFEIIPLLWRMIQDLRNGTYGVDILAVTAIITAVIMQEYWAAVVIVLMLTGGESLEDFAEHRAGRELRELLKHAPQKAHIVRGNKEFDVRASEVRKGDTVIIRAGEIVPVDSLVLEGSSSLDESNLTGESLPVVKSAGQLLLSGAVNIDGVITAEALRPAAESQYEQIVKLVKAAQKSKAPFVRLADRYAIPFTIISFGIAGIAWALSGESVRFLQVLVVATPCPLILAAPIAIISGMSRAAKQGIIIKNGSALERLATAQTFAFDKTGTITQGKPTVDQVMTFQKYTISKVLATAAALEQHSNHILAAAIVQKAKDKGAKTLKAKHIREVAGNGLIGVISGKEAIVGRSDLLAQYDISLPKHIDTKKLQQTATFIAADKQLIGIITFKDELRPEAKHTLQRLKGLDVRELLLVTGDSRHTALAVAKKVGIKKVFAGALPGDKIQAIESYAERPVAFVGDGVNDAPVLTASDVGIALGARGSTAASESADVVILPDNLELAADGRQIAQRTFSIAKQSIVIGIGLSVLLMLIFATGKFKPIYGALIQEVVDIVVIFNALRAHHR